MEKDNLEILLEDIRGKFDLVLEGHEVLRKEIRDTRTELGEKIQFVDFKVDAVGQRVEALDQRVEALDQKVGSLDRKVDGIAADLKAHREDTEAHPKVYQVKE